MKEGQQRKTFVIPIEFNCDENIQPGATYPNVLCNVYIDFQKSVIEIEREGEIYVEVNIYFHLPPRPPSYDQTDYISVLFESILRMLSRKGWIHDYESSEDYVADTETEEFELSYYSDFFLPNPEKDSFTIPTLQDFQTIVEKWKQNIKTKFNLDLDNLKEGEKADVSLSVYVRFFPFTDTPEEIPIPSLQWKDEYERKSPTEWKRLVSLLFTLHAREFFMGEEILHHYLHFPHRFRFYIIFPDGESMEV